MRRSIPNLLSLSRVIIAVTILILSARLSAATYLVMIILVAAAMLTDYLDGFLARRWHVTSEIGYVLDTLGDRAIHLALTLFVMVRYGVNPVIVWLLIFRDIGIYAVRVLSTNWLSKSKKARWMSLVHATALRIWLALFLVRDGLRIYLEDDVLGTAGFEVTTNIIISGTIVFSYFALAKSFSWIIEQDHAAL